MARQPIYDRRGRVFAYELLYRNESGDQAAELEPDRSAKALVSTLVDIGLDELVGSKLAFVNVPPELLGERAIELLPRDRVVLEILETTEFNDATRRAMGRLSNRGYTLAFDDYIFACDQDQFLDYVKIVKVDVLNSTQDDLKRRVPELVKRGLKVLAEKVETPEMHRDCLAAGCHLFQGYFFAKPQTLRGQGIPANRVAIIHLLARLQDPEVSISELDRLVGTDISLSYRLLRLINSAAMGNEERVDSIRQAVFMLGIQKVSALASLVSLSAINRSSDELIHLALVRASMCEQIALAKGFENPYKHFTVGLLSVLDALIGVPMPDILSKVPLSDDVVHALTGINATTDVGRTLNCTYAYERGNFEAAVNACGQPDAIGAVYRKAIHWANETVRDFAA